MDVLFLPSFLVVLYVSKSIQIAVDKFFYRIFGNVRYFDVSWLHLET